MFQKENDKLSHYVHALICVLQHHRRRESKRKREMRVSSYFSYEAAIKIVKAPEEKAL